MSILKSRKFAAVVMVLCIIAGIVLGQSRAPKAGLQTDLDIKPYEKYISDAARVLDDKQRETICRYNARWEADYGVTVAFVSVFTLSEDMEDYAYNWGGAARLDEMDAVLLYSMEEDGYYVAPGDDLSWYLTDSAQNRLAACLDDASIPFGKAAVKFYDTMDSVLRSALGKGSAPASSSSSGLNGLITLLIILLIVYLILSAIEKARYDAYRRRYYGVANPPVVFRPIFFWHGPTSSWYRRRWVRPAPTPARAPRAPRPGGSYRPTGTSRPSGGFGGSRPSSPSRPSGGFGGTRSSGGSRSHSSFGGSRSGGFGGSRGGGSRGGGFGGRR